MDHPITRRGALGAAGLMAASGAANAAVDGDVARALRAKCEALARADDLSGAVLLAKDGRVLYRAAFGLANRADATPNRPDTRFNLASIGKMFTAVAVLRLVEQGRLGLDDPVGAVLPDYPNRAVAEEVRVRHLLGHTSGLGNYWDRLAEAPNARVIGLEDALPLFAAQPLAFPPGERFAYSNAGYVVLGLMVERLTGREYFDHVSETIWRPLGMPGAGAFRLDGDEPRVAVGYTRDPERPGAWRNNLFANAFRGSSAGGAYATVDDLAAFAHALKAGRLLGPEMTRTFTEGRQPYARGRYGYGCSEEIVAGHRILGHSGGHIGIAGELMIFEDLGYTCVILTNGEVDAFWDLSAFVRRRIAGESDGGRDYAFTRRIVGVAAADGEAAGLAAARAEPDRKLREGVVDLEGLKRLHRRDPQAGLALLRFNVAAFPDSPDARWSLAEALRVSGPPGPAMAAYERYLELSPGDADALARIAKLKAASARARPGA